MGLADRKEQEAAFHDRRERARRDLSSDEFTLEYPNGRFYSIARKERRILEDILNGMPRGSKVLDYCCGPGTMSLQLARAGMEVYGIDISPQSVRGAQELLRSEGYGDRAHFDVMDAENLRFGDQTFDLIVCTGVLHHLDVNAAYPQLARVVKASGKVYCLEALGYNPIIQLYRRLTPRLRTAWETEHILTGKELRLAERYFGRVDVTYLYLSSLCAVPLRKTVAFDAALAMLETFDELLLKIPGLQLMAWQMAFTLSAPKSSPTQT